MQSNSFTASQLRAAQSAAMQCVEARKVTFPPILSPLAEFAKALRYHAAAVESRNRFPRYSPIWNHENNHAICLARQCRHFARLLS